MKYIDKVEVRLVLFICIVGVVLGSLCLAWEPYFGSNIGHSFQTGLAGRNGQRSLLWDSVDYPQNGRLSCESELACSLPKGWQAGWCGGTLWITHHNPDGSVADSLPFDSPDGLYGWIETHPDCCDVDVEKTVLKITEDAI